LYFFAVGAYQFVLETRKVWVVLKNFLAEQHHLVMVFFLNEVVGEQNVEFGNHLSLAVARQNALNFLIEVEVVWQQIYQAVPGGFQFFKLQVAAKASAACL
jgi:hypothetical protein